MTKKSVIWGIVIVLIVVGAFFVLQNNEPQNEGKIKVAASIFPVYDIAQNVAGENIEVVLILPPGASPHTFEPSPSTIKDLEGVSLILGVDPEIDNWATSLADNVTEAKFVQVRSNIDFLKLDTAHGTADVTDDSLYDPHYWMDINNGRKIANNIAAELAELDPENAADYNLRARSYSDELTELSRELSVRLSELPDIELVTFHDSFAYFANHFGFEIRGVVEPFPGQEPTPKYLSDLSDKIDIYQIKAIFTEPQLATDVIEQFATDKGVRLGVLDPIGGVPGRDSYIDLMRYNVNQIIEGVK